MIYEIIDIYVLYKYIFDEKISSKELKDGIRFL